MKLKTLTGILLIVFSVSLLSCASHTTTVSTKRTSTTTTTKRTPPGQAKKANGSKSARAYAPGHNKN